MYTSNICPSRIEKEQVIREIHTANVQMGSIKHTLTSIDILMRSAEIHQLHSVLESLKKQKSKAITMLEMCQQLISEKWEVLSAPEHHRFYE